MKEPSKIHLELPKWVVEFTKAPERKIPNVEDRVQFVLKLASQNVHKGTGGPFGAAIFDAKSHTLISLGVNVVVSQNASIAHAEIMAITNAQQKLGIYSLHQFQHGEFELVSSAEPCAMCTGAIFWAGIKRCVSSTTKEDVEAFGFDEGDKPKLWKESFKKRGIEYIEKIKRPQGVNVLQNYAEKNGLIYNGK